MESNSIHFNNLIEKRKTDLLNLHRYRKTVKIILKVVTMKDLYIVITFNDLMDQFQP